MIKIKISNLFSLTKDVNLFQPTHFISILNPGLDLGWVMNIHGIEKSIRLFFYDDDDTLTPGHSIDKINCLNRVVFFMQELSQQDNDKRLLIHCHAGASRSPAIAYIYYAIQLGKNKENEAFCELLKITNKPWPSYDLIAIADELLERDGQLLKPLLLYRSKNPNRYVAYKRLNNNRNLDQFDRKK